ncbi:alkaline phosphatase [uncultured Algimonas sp.]|uniref:alkaline phosphatase n=1 Tax=uncultured Algimonas sp. TaxID=1547920 RepID=UPI0026143570|nr:alkaline phosphatase [uncultured Algimonas sp.]
MRKTMISAGAAALLLGGCATTQTASPYERAQGVLAERIDYRPVKSPAKNVILFIGDGMGISTVTAARIFEGQQRGMTGEENQLSWEAFPHTALSKTYNTNQQVPDSAGTATAMYTGVKTSAGVLGVGPEVARGDCAAVKAGELETFWDAARAHGLKLGLVTSTRITHATPAAAYAHSSERNWEYDGELSVDANAGGCRDIAAQFVETNIIDVAMGGGRRGFLRDADEMPDYPGEMGRRMDGVSLIDVWKDKNPDGTVVFDQAGFDALRPGQASRVLGLFEPSHLKFDSMNTGPGKDPSLAEMTRKAIELLSRSGEGFVLMVEGGRIDHAHHGGNAFNALSDTVAFAEAVAVADRMTSDADTTLLVTADHSHVFTMAGYPTRGNPILGLVKGNDKTGRPTGEPYLARDGKPYTTLGYANGPGAMEGPRPFLSDDDVAEHDHRQQSLIPLGSETHAGEDVAIYAKGPRSFVVSGVVEQTFVHDVVRYALDLD